MLTGIGRSGGSPIFGLKADGGFCGGCGLPQLTPRAGSNRHKHSNGRCLVPPIAITASASESHIYNYSANIDCRSNPQYSAVLHRENFSATL